MRWSRGPHVPILLILVIVLLDYTSYRKTIAWRWPVVRWTMYEVKGPTEPAVSYRRFVVQHADGRRETIGLGRAFAFLDRPYRLDRGLDKNLAAFLEACLRELRRREGDHLVSLTYEKRTWHYQQRTYQEHLDEDPVWSFRVHAITGAPEALRTDRPADGNQIAHGEFRKLGMRTGRPRGWVVDAQWYGVAIDLETDERAFMLPASAAAQSASQTATLPAGGVQTIALARATSPGAAIEVTTASGTTTIDVPGDGAWHRVAGRAVVGADGAIQVRLRNQGAGDAYFDDVAVYPSAE